MLKMACWIPSWPRWPIWSTILAALRLAGPKSAKRRLLDGVVITAQALAVVAEDVELVLEGGVIAGEQVARIRVLGHHAQRLLLAATPNQDGRVRPLDGLRRVQRLGQLVVLAGKRLDLARPHLQADAQRLLQPLKRSATGGNGTPKP